MTSARRNARRRRPGPDIPMSSASAPAVTVPIVSGENTEAAPASKLLRSSTCRDDAILSTSSTKARRRDAQCSSSSLQIVSAARGDRSARLMISWTLVSGVPSCRMPLSRIESPRWCLVETASVVSVSVEAQWQWTGEMDRRSNRLRHRGGWRRPRVKCAALMLIDAACKMDSRLDVTNPSRRCSGSAWRSERGSGG